MFRIFLLDRVIINQREKVERREADRRKNRKKEEKKRKNKVI